MTEIRVSHVAANLGKSATHDIAVDPSTSTVVVTGTASFSGSPGYANGRVWVIDGKTDKLVATLKLTGAANAGVAVDPATHTFYVADAQLPNPAPAQPGGVAVINGRTHKVTATIPDPGIGAYSFAGPAVAVNSKTDTIYADGAGYAVTVIDGETNTVTATVQNTYYPGPLSVDSASDTVYEVGGAGGGTTGLWVINGHTNLAESSKAAAPATILTPGAPPGVAVDAKTGRIYASGASAKGGLSIIHSGADRIAHTVKIADGNPAAFGVGVDTASNDIYVANGNEVEGCAGFVTEINGRTDKVTATVNDIDLAGAVAVDSSHNRVWVTNGDTVDAYRGGFSRKAKKCGGGGVVIG